MMSTNKRLVSILLVLAMVLTMLPMTVFAADTVTLYCDAPSSWTACYVYWWGSKTATNPTWPGVAMTKGSDGIWYYDVPADATNVIFNNGSGTQSADLTMPTDDNVQFNYVAKTWTTYGTEVEEPVIEMVTVYVEVPASWGTPNAYFWESSVQNSASWPGDAMTYVDGNVYTATVPSDCAGLIFNGTGGQTADLTVPTDDNVMYSVATSSWGELVINEPVEVTYTYVVAGSAELCGTAWDTANTANTMTEADGVASITYTDVPAGDYELKVVCVGSDGSTVWYGNGDANVAFTLSDTADVTVTFNAETYEVNATVEYETVVEPEPEPEPEEVVYYLRGSMNEWVADESNAMILQDDGTYAITISLTAGTYEYKAANADWTWEVPMGTNLTLELAEDAEVTFVLDVNNYTLTNNAPEIEVVYNYFVAGAEALCGVEWDPGANQMTLNEDTGLYEITFAGIAAGEYEYKITTGSWDTPSYGPAEGGNYCVTLGAKSDVTIIFNKETLEVDVELSALEATYILVDGEPQYISVPMGGVAYLVVDATASDMILTVSGGRMYYDWYVQMGVQQMAPNMMGNAQITLADGSYTLTVVNTSEETAQDLSVLAYAPKLGSEEKPDQLVMGENSCDVEAWGAYIYTWTATENGSLTISVDTANCTDWTYCINGVLANGGYYYGETRYSDDEEVVDTETVYVKAGDVYTIIIGTASWGAATVSFTASFALPEEYLISDTVLQLGENNLTLDPGAITTIYEFCPEETGIYSFTANDENALVGYWGGGTFFVWDQTENKTYTLEREVPYVGPSVMIGISGVETVTLTVVREGDVFVQQTFTTVYENTHSFIDYALPDGASLIDIDDTVVLGSDGFYHVGSETGPLVVIDFGYTPVPLSSVADLGQMSVSYVGDDGHIYKTDYSAATLEYAKKGVYPVTEELAAMIQTVAEHRNWVEDGYVTTDDPDNAWLAFCQKVKLADIRWQLNADATAESETVNLRLITWVDSLNYSKVSFMVEIEGYTCELECTTAYVEIKAGDKVIEDASALFGENAAYFITYTITNVPAAYFDTEITVYAVWTDLNGAEAVSDARTIYVSDGL